jgi:inorganic phosphate transporter, PiT family
MSNLRPNSAPFRTMPVSKPSPFGPPPPAATINGGIDRLSLFFGVLFLGITGYFLMWGLEYTNYSNVLVFVMATAFGLFMAFNIGGNDVANSFGTSVGAGTLTLKQALVIAAIFEVSGAVIAGGEVTNTIRGGIVNLDGIEVEPFQFIYIMMSALLSAALWLMFASKKGYPVSTTHSIIGGIVGSSIMLGILLNGRETALALVQWAEVGKIVLSWVVSPVLGGVVSWFFYHLIKEHIILYNEKAEARLQLIKEEKRSHKDKHRESFAMLSEGQQVEQARALARDAHAYSDADTDMEESVLLELESEYFKGLQTLKDKKEAVQAHRALEYWVPLVAALGALIISAMMLFKGLNNLQLGLSILTKFLYMGMIASAVWMATLVLAKTMRGKSLKKSTFYIFSWMQVFTAAAFAFSHGSNDIANAIGPFAAIMDVLKTGDVSSRAAVPTITMVTFGVGLVAGLWFIGKEVIMTVGHHLTELHPASGFSAELAAAAVVLLASILGIPVSSTHILIGAVLGIGLVNKKTNWSLMKPIGLAWIITLPSAGLLSAGIFWVLNGLL